MTIFAPSGTLLYPADSDMETKFNLVLFDSHCAGSIMTKM